MMQIFEFLVCAVFMYGLVSIKCDLPSVNGNDEPFPKEKCESLLENCSCYDYERVVGIVCNNATDFLKFSSLLATDAIFHFENTTYEITLNELEYLPAQSLEGLIVFRLYLDDPNLPAIDKDAFQGVRQLRRFHVRRSSVKEVPVFRSINDSIDSINIDNSLLTALTGENLQDLPLVTRLSFVNNSIEHIDPDAFKGTNSVIILDLSHNLLTSIPPRILDTMKALKKFVLTDNRLVQVDGLFDVTHPRFIYLDFNNISNVDSVLVYNMTKVEAVILASNPIRKLSRNSFKGKIPKARFLYLDHCQLQEFDVGHFHGLNKLAILDLSYNLIEDISNQRMNFGFRLELVLIGNKIRSFRAQITYIVKRIYLNDNKLQALGQTLHLSQATEVSIARNQLQYLSAEDFRTVDATANLELQGNEIKWIDRLIFLKIRNNLHYLDLSANRITALNNSVQYLSKLKSLNVSDNRIQSFAEGEFTGLNELSELFLQQNRIMSLSGQLQQLPLLQYLVVTQNNIETIRLEQLPQKLQYMYLADNPLECDCRLLPFLQWLNTSDSPRTDIELCSPTADAKYKREHAQCPEMCHCTCTKDDDDYFMTVNCNSRNMRVLPSFLTGSAVQIDNTPSATSENSRLLVFDLNIDSNYHISDRVRGINLKNNSLESFDSAQLPVDLIHLQLAQNQLRTLPESLLYNLPQLRMVTLSKNPWDCDCNAVGFKNLLVSKMNKIPDVNDTRCGVKVNSESPLDGRAIWILTDLDLCPTDIAWYISVSFGVLAFLLLCLATKIMYTKYQLNIKVYLYSRGFLWVKARDIDYDKEFDAFISFSHKDETFVTNELISVIENKAPNIRLRAHHNDSRGQELIHDDILRDMQNSKITILVFTKNFIESEWCLMVFRAARVQAIEDKAHHVIVIKLGDLPKHIDPATNVYRDILTCLTWEEKYFWNKLLYALPTSSTPRDIGSQQEELTLKGTTSGPNFQP